MPRTTALMSTPHDGWSSIRPISTQREQRNRCVLFLPAIYYTQDADIKVPLNLQGRKIGKPKCADKPNMKEIFDCAALLKFETALEARKQYCRDYWQQGRIRVRLFDDDGKPMRGDIPTRTFTINTPLHCLLS